MDRDSQCDGRTRERKGGGDKDLHVNMAQPHDSQGKASKNVSFNVIMILVITHLAFHSGLAFLHRIMSPASLRASFMILNLKVTAWLSNCFSRRGWDITYRKFIIQSEIFNYILILWSRVWCATCGKIFLIISELTWIIITKTVVCCKVNGPLKVDSTLLASL